jgi:hypothetical protein
MEIITYCRNKNCGNYHFNLGLFTDGVFYVFAKCPLCKIPHEFKIVNYDITKAKII